MTTLNNYPTFNKAIEAVRAAHRDELEKAKRFAGGAAHTAPHRNLV